MRIDMICNICKQRVQVRVMDNFNGHLPVVHENPETKDKCHGFYEGGHLVKEGE